MANSSMKSIMDIILAPHLQRSQEDNRPIVVMTCGLAGPSSPTHSLHMNTLTSSGSGKTTLAKAIQSTYPSYHRLSGDEMIYQKHGIYGIDYEASPTLYAQYQAEKDEVYLSTFRTLLAQKEDVILERSFYAKDDRDEFQAMAERAGAKVVLVHLKAQGEQGKRVLWERICKRSEGVKTADSALDISRELFEMYWNGFEDPVDEGEIVVDIL
jgi:predicted kinase